MKTSPPAIELQLPHSIEAEQGALSSMLQSPRDGVAEAMERIDRDYFYGAQHQVMFDTLVELWNADRAIDLILFTQALRDKNLLPQVGGAAYVSEIYDKVPSPVAIKHYLDIVRDKYVLRKIIFSARESMRRAFEEQADTSQILEDYQSTAIQIGQINKDSETSKPLAAYVPGALKQIEATYHHRGTCTGIPTGFVDLDRTMNGFEAPLTYYFAARPAMGKSSLMLAFAENIAIKAAEKRRRVKIFSVEMTGQTLAKRLICSRADISLRNLRFGLLHRDDVALANEAAKDLMTDYIRIDEKGDLSIYEFRARARQAVIKDKCELIMIDYLQRMRGSSKRSQGNREIEINEIAQGISATAKELNVPIVVLAQLNRKPEERVDGKPELGDLRESGSIEQEARFVGLLWRPAYYATNEKRREKLMKQLEINDPTEFNEFAQCIVAKQNEGPVGPINLRFKGMFARYEPEYPDRPFLSNRKDQRQQIPGQEELQQEEPEKPNEDIVATAARMFEGTIEPK